MEAKSYLCRSVVPSSQELGPCLGSRILKLRSKALRLHGYPSLPPYRSTVGSTTDHDMSFWSRRTSTDWTISLAGLCHGAIMCHLDDLAFLSDHFGSEKRLS